jgi:hypothetical protein
MVLLYVFRRDSQCCRSSHFFGIRIPLFNFIWIRIWLFYSGSDPIVPGVGTGSIPYKLKFLEVDEINPNSLRNKSDLDQGCYGSQSDKKIQSRIWIRNIGDNNKKLKINFLV